MGDLKMATNKPLPQIKQMTEVIKYNNTHPFPI